jgi:hypothetical protein
MTKIREFIKHAFQLIALVGLTSSWVNNVKGGVCPTDPANCQIFEGTESQGVDCPPGWPSGCSMDTAQTYCPTVTQYCYVEIMTWESSNGFGYNTNCECI